MAQPPWQYSEALGTQFYRDDNGQVHYGDGTTGLASKTWQDGNGRTVYAANSAGPASTAGGAYQATSIAPPPTAGDQWNSGGMTKPMPMPGGPASQGPGGQMGQGAAAFGGGVNPGAVGSISSYTAGQNPYLQQMGNALVQQNTQNLQRNVLPGIASGAMASGGFGGSRQGVLEANALSDLNTSNANALAGLAGNAYGQALNFDVARRGQDQNYGLGMLNANNNYNLGMTNANNNYDLGLRNNQLGYFNGANSYNTAQGNLGLGYAGLDRQINNDNMSWQQQGINNGLNIWDRLQAGNNTAINAGNNIQNTPMNNWNQFSQGINSIGRGYGTSTGSNSTSGNPLLGAVGGAQLGSQLGTQVANWWGS